MLINNKQSFNQAKLGIFNFLLLVFVSTTEIWAQVRSVPVAPPVAETTEDFTWWYVSLFILVVGLAGAIFWWLNNKKSQQSPQPYKVQKSGSERESKSLDADKELEWLRKNPKLMGGKKKSASPVSKNRPANAAQNLKSAKQEVEEPAAPSSNGQETNSPLLPIFSIHRLELARPFDALPISDDEDLMSAVEQGYDEFEEDEEVRELAVRILAAFKKRNSVEALSQIALYDLSSSLRSKAVSILSEFDHESVFETILLANADPTREVRAAAARGLSKLTFDRADAWTRIAESGEEGRIVQTARAAIESGFVEMSFDRLVHSDHKHAYEAFTLMALLIKAGEMERIFNTLENHRDMNVRRAILHTIKVTKDQKALEGLYSLLEKNSLPIEFQEEIDKAIEEIGFVTV